MLWTIKALPGTAVTSIMIDKQINENEKPTEIQTISTGWLALWFERFASDQENMSLTKRCSGTELGAKILIKGQTMETERIERQSWMKD